MAFWKPGAKKPEAPLSLEVADLSAPTLLLRDNANLQQQVHLAVVPQHAQSEPSHLEQMQ